MNTKLLALTITTTAFSFALHAQTKTTTSSGDQSITFGIRAGVNFTNINGKDYSDKKLDNSLKAGFNVGVNAEVPIAPDFYVQPGLLLTTKGAKIKNGSTDYKVNLSYLELPVNLLYKPELGAGKLMLGVGPYVAYAIGGKVKDFNNKDQDIKFANSVTAMEYLNTAYPSPYSIIKHFDVGGNLLVGYEASNKISIQLNAQLGLTKINPKIDGVTNDHTKFMNTGFGVSLCYRFM